MDRKTKNPSPAFRLLFSLSFSYSGVRGWRGKQRGGEEIPECSCNHSAFERNCSDLDPDSEASLQTRADGNYLGVSSRAKKRRKIAEGKNRNEKKVSGLCGNGLKAL